MAKRERGERESERAGQTFLSCHLNPSPRVALLCGRGPADCRPLSSAEAISAVVTAGGKISTLTLT